MDRRDPVLAGAASLSIVCDMEQANEPKNGIIPTPESERTVTTKRGLDITKVEWVIGREQEKDLALIHRIDQIQFFCELPEEDKKQYNYKRKPSDPPLLQSIWEAHRQYQAVQSDDPAVALKWFE